jgi:Flp pilus assembly protein TadD
VVDDSLERHNQLYKQAQITLRPIFNGSPRAKPTAVQLRMAEEGCALLDQVLLLNPQNWNACWVQGVAWRNVQRWDRAHEAFSRAYAINPGEREVAREYAIACAQTRRYDEAIDVAKRATEIDPADHGLRANYALILNSAGRRDEARAEIARALASDVSDAVTLAAYRQISASTLRKS